MKKPKPNGRRARVQLCQAKGCETLTIGRLCSLHRVAEETRKLIEKARRR